ncbi:uncharacterized protein [Fopius arisanus]|uniref:Odorant receptor n=1 Tax=Fopius arisanus TaxID=64838 RepID=A0A9R1SUI0_9HYME|nr:PREDICTED: uncharacterized protein LOC105263090 isoform X2 [Fopius arisanus]
MTTTEAGTKRERVFPINKSYLYFNLNCLTVFGIWNPYKEGLKYWLYRIYSTYFVGVVMITRVLSLAVQAMTADNASQFLQDFSLLAVETADTLKGIAFLIHRVEVLELSKTFNWERHLSSTRQMTHYRNEVLTNSLHTSKKFTTTIIIALIQYFTLHFYRTLCQSDHKVENLPIGSIPLRYFFILSNFWVAFICDYVTFTSLGLVAVCHDSFIMSVMINITAQLRLLNFRLEKCHMATITIRSGDANETSSRIHFECVEKEMSGESLVLDPNEELVNCIKCHQQIVRMVNIFKHMYNKVLLPQLFNSLLLITISGLQMILGQQGNLTDSLVACGFLIPRTGTITTRYFRII